MNALLAVRGLTKHYRGIVAVDAVSFDLAEGNITGLIGPNGSGKSTLFDCITGFTRMDAGEVSLAGGAIAGDAPQRIARRGLVRTFQTLRVFPLLSAIDNMLAAAQAHQGFGFLGDVAEGAAVVRAEAEARERAGTLLDELDLTAHVQTLAGRLSYGQQKLLVLGMALMAKPRLVLLDEPVAGVNPTLVERIKGHVRAWNAAGTTFFIIEHNLRMVMDLCHSVLVLDNGRLIMEDTPERVASDDRVLEAYVGRRRAP